MSRVKVVMPQMGESITNGTITKWHKKAGDGIEIDEILLEISTDKVESEIPSPVKGRIEALHFPEGETVDVGILIAEIEDDLSIPFSGGKSDAAPAEKKAEAPKEQTKEAPADKTEASASSGSSGERRFYTPLVKAMAKDAGIPLSELEGIEGSGAGGRVNKQDLEDYISGKGSSSSASSSAPSKAAPAKTQGPAAYSKGERVEIIPMDNMRKMIADNMVASKQISPHVNSMSEVDLTHLVKFREGFKEEFQRQEGFKLTYTPFICRAIIMALKDFPYVNASVDGSNIVLKKDINLGLAVAVPGNGLIVPVIKEADTLNMTGLCRNINDLALKARSKKLTMDNLTGGTFTFSNVGSFGTLMATPIILQPQVGIYASGVIQKRPVVVDDAIAVRNMMYGTHAYDHRLVDGELGGNFLEAIHRHLREMNPKDMF